MTEQPTPPEKKLPPLLASLFRSNSRSLPTWTSLTTCLSSSYAEPTLYCAGRYLVATLRPDRPRNANSGPLNASTLISFRSDSTRATAAWRFIRAGASHAGLDTKWSWNVAADSAHAFGTVAFCLQTVRMTSNPAPVSEQSLFLTLPQTTQDHIREYRLRKNSEEEWLLYEHDLELRPATSNGKRGGLRSSRLFSKALEKSGKCVQMHRALPLPLLRPRVQPQFLHPRLTRHHFSPSLPNFS